MKKHLLLVILAVVAMATTAQNNDMYSFVYHDKPGYSIDLHNIMQQRDGDFVIHTIIFGYDGNQNAFPLGNMFYKVSSATHTLTDSLFVADTVWRDFLLARDPLGEGNIRAAYEYHEDCDSTFLRISHFPDDDLNTNPGEDIVTPVCQGPVSSAQYSAMLDCRGDLIMKYYKEWIPYESYDEHIVRFGPDGTLKHHALLNENENDLMIGPFRVFKESPLQYYQWKDTDNGDYLAIVVIDSLFQKNTAFLNKVLREESIDIYNKEYEHLEVYNRYDIEVAPIGGDDVLVAAPYVHDTNFYPITAEYGVAVAKFDIRTMRPKDYIVFNDHHGYYNREICTGLKVMADGTVYFLYQKKLHEPDVYIVKMDTDLNVEWKRFCKTGYIVIEPEFGYSTIFDDGSGNEKGIAWSWYASNASNDGFGLVHFFLNHDGTVGTNEAGIEVRPYAYWPNPTQDQLHLQYSPDVQPRQVELYDLQGRLVHTQQSGLEHIDMQGLSAGQYLMKVTLEDGKAYSDKVVKE